MSTREQVIGNWFIGGGKLRFAPSSPDWFLDLELRRSVAASPAAIMALSERIHGADGR